MKTLKKDDINIPTDCFFLFINHCDVDLGNMRCKSITTLALRGHNWMLYSHRP